MTSKEIIIKFLNEGGFRYQEVDENICFKFQLVNYIFMHNACDELLQLVMIFYDVTDENRQKVLECANTVNQEKALAKLTVDEDSVWVNCEDFVDDNYPETKIPLMLGLMETARQRFYELMRKQDEET